MAAQSKNYLYVVLALAACALLLLPYFGILDFISPASDPAPRTAKKEYPGDTDISSTPQREYQKAKPEDQKKRLAEIEQLLD